MPKYECAVVLSSTLSEEQTQEHVEQVRGWIAGLGAEVSDVDLWGRKRLAYPIRKQRDGYYAIYYFSLEGEGARLAELDKRFQTAEAVLRYLLVRLPDLKEIPRVPAEDEKAADIDEEVEPPAAGDEKDKQSDEASGEVEGGATNIEDEEPAGPSTAVESETGDAGSEPSERPAE